MHNCDSDDEVKTFYQSETETLDYKVNYVNDLKRFNDTIISSTWTVEGELIVVSDSFDDYTAIGFLSGGIIGNTYEVLNSVTTSQGRIIETPMYIEIKKHFR